MWLDASEQFKGRDKLEKQVALWKQAIAANPHRAWAWRGLQDAYTEAEQWKEARANAEQEVIAVKDGTDDDRASSFFDRAIVSVLQLRNGVADKDSLEAALLDFESYEKAGGYAAANAQYRAEVLLALKRPDEAAQAALQAARLRPDYAALVANLFEKYYENTTSGQRMAAAYRYMQRDPYDGQRLESLAHWHVMWSGSPIVGLQTIRLIQERAPEVGTQSLEGMAWGQLGDGVRDYEARYARSTALSASERYIGWYNAARRKAQGEPSRVNLDYATGIATIVHSDGQIEKRQDHPISGKRMLLQVGAAYIKCEYDEQGDNLLHIYDSAGNDIRLEYYPNSTISRLRLKDGADISFVYNEAKKPTRIALKGVGEINVTYKPGGVEIEKVESPQGRTVASKVTSTFQELMDMLHPFERSNWGDVPELPYKDERLNALRATRQKAEQAASQNAAAAVAAGNATLVEAEYLIEHVRDRREYEDQARRLVLRVFQAAQQASLGAPRFDLGLRSVSLWHDLMLKVREQGLGAQEWKQWGELRGWAAGQAYVPDAPKAQIEALQQKLDARPLNLLEAAQWLPKSYLSTPGFWRRFPQQELLPAALRSNTRENAVLVRANADVVVGTDAGLCVFRRGHWEWFGYDEGQKRFSATAASKTAAWQTLALAEDGQGVLWVGTANGLFRLAGDYAAETTRWQSDGPAALPSTRVTQLAARGSAIFIGTDAGLRVLSGDKIVTPARFASEAITLLRAADADQTPAQAPLLIGTPSALWGAPPSGLADAVQLSGETVQDALWEGEENRVYYLQGSGIYALSWKGSGAAGAPVYLLGQQNVYKSRKVAGLARVPVDDGEYAVAALTDQGLSIYRDQHFEHAKLPLADRTVGVNTLATRDRRSYLLTSEGVYALERGQALGDADGEVSDLLTMKEWKATFVARGDGGLQVVFHDRINQGAQRFSDISATHLARDDQARLIANDGNTIVRFERGQTTPQELFNATPSGPNGETPSYSEVNSILAASDGALWVVAGPALFRWKDGKTTEFNLYKDAPEFPSRSEWLSRVIETFDHRIWVIASNEVHLNYQGMPLKGGVLEWDGAGFKRLNLPEKSSYWFVTGYTPLDDKTAIAGTTNGFVQCRDNRFASYYNDLKDTSYQELSARVPQLFLGTRGAKLGEKTWLFGSAGGLVAYQEGQWFYPDRLNWMLPDDERYGGKYGVRCVHAVETDEAGHVYAGTDRGLLIYDSGGGDPASFLISNEHQMQAYRNLEQDKLRQEAEIMLSGIKPDSDLGRKVRQVFDSRQEVDRLETRLTAGAAIPPRGTATGTNENAAPAGADLSEAERDQLQKDLEARRQAQTRLLLELERDQKSLYQMLELKPLDLAALRGRLEAGQVVLQYLPTPEKLYIQVVTKDDVQLRQYDVPREELEKRAIRAARELAYQGVEPDRGFKLVRALGELTTEDDLLWLYDKLLRPVENDLEGSKHVFIVPVGPLTYVPFAALLRSASPQPEYAIERYAFGYLPSLYLWDLVQDHQSAHLKSAFILGDPDGSLPGARLEAGRVHDILQNGAEPYLGEKATQEALQAQAQSSGLIHLATHGKLDEDKPENSYLLLADGRRLSVVDAYSLLDLKKTDLVVLSACETGLGKQGLEYATLARSFAGAGAPSIMATLWSVNDRSTPALIEAFYKNRAGGDDNIIALAKAQRQLLKGDEKLRKPGLWASYILLGKP